MHVLADPRHAVGEPVSPSKSLPSASLASSGSAGAAIGGLPSTRRGNPLAYGPAAASQGGKWNTRNPLTV